MAVSKVSSSSGVADRLFFQVQVTPYEGYEIGEDEWTDDYIEIVIKSSSNQHGLLDL